MKIKLLLLPFLLVLPLSGFAQEKIIEIQAQKEFSNSVILTPACGKGNDMELPFTVFWDKKMETLKIELKSNKETGKMLFVFPKKMKIQKSVMKLRKEVWFAKELKKCQFKKAVNAGISVKELVNVDAPEPDTIKTLDLADRNATMKFLFKKPFQDDTPIVIPLHLYAGSKETYKKERSLKIEYEAIFTLLIKKRAETVAPAKETVNCKALFKANEQLAELLLDVKNSNQANLASLKQKYATIKKSVADPEYKKCKEEYKSFESLCSKIDNRLK